MISSRLQAGTGMIGGGVGGRGHARGDEGGRVRVHASPEHPVADEPASDRADAPQGEDTSSSPPSTPPTVSLSVLNGTLKTGEAATAGAAARRSSATRRRPGNAPTQSYAQTWVYYASRPRPGGGRRRPASSATAPRRRRCRPRSPRPRTSWSSSASDFPGKLAIAAAARRRATSALPADITPDSQAYLTEFRAMAHHVSFPVLYPTVTQDGSEVPLDRRRSGPTTSPPRAGTGARCTPTSQMPSTPGANWGIEETRFVDAPILANPSAMRKLGRAHLPVLLQRRADPHDRVHRGTARPTGCRTRSCDDLSNADMIAIAKSLEPAG